MVDDIKCLVCGYKSVNFGEIYFFNQTDTYSGLCGIMPKGIGHVGSVKILVCPNCGALHSTMRNHISMDERKYTGDREETKPVCIELDKYLKA